MRTQFGAQGRERSPVRGGQGIPELVDALTEEPSLKSYHYLPSVRGDLLLKLGRYAEARVEFECASSITKNAREREILLERAKDASARLST